MKLRVLLVIVLSGGVFAFVVQGCGQPDDAFSRTNEPPPLVVDKNAPLLLDEPGENEKVTTDAGVKNATCYVCHANYTEEPLAQWHAKANISCADCHGESIAHENDENHLTPPDKMYPASEIDGACLKCHATHDVQPAEVVRRWQQHTGDKKTDVLCKQCHEGHDVPAAAVVRKWQKQSGQNVYEKPIVCTDCHGEHRLKMRSVRY
jgi:formate-dependent nitrite reductase cytochrome c552 subunit